MTERKATAKEEADPCGMTARKATATAEADPPPSHPIEQKALAGDPGLAKDDKGWVDRAAASGISF
jgi:hypothetical protein